MKLINRFKNAYQAFAGQSSVRGLSNEIGAPGVENFSGYITEDYNQTLQGSKAIEQYQQMRLGDAQVHAILEAIKLPLRSANWHINSTNDEYREFIEDCLDDLYIPFKDNIREALNFLDFGFYYFEKIYKMRDDGRIGWAKFAPRLPTAHQKWETEKGKGSGKNKNEGVTQQLPNLDYTRPDLTNMQPQIPMDKLLLFINQKEGNNWDGWSVLRTAWKHWFYKDMMYKIEGISAERYGVGVPIIRMPSGAGTAERNKAIEWAKNLKSADTSYLVLPGGKDEWDADILIPKGDTKATNIQEIIKHHNRMITINVLAQFLDLGSDSTGSFALSRDQSDFFLLSLKAVGEYMCTIYNDAIKQLMNYNYGDIDEKEMPTMEVSDIAQVDYKEFSESLKTLSDAGLVDQDEELKDYIRELWKLPELSDEAKKQIKKDKIKADKEIAKVEKKEEKKVTPEKEKEIKDKEIKKEKEEKLTDTNAKKTFTDWITDYYLAKKKTLNPSSREKKFVVDIGENERALDKVYSEYDNLFNIYEGKLRAYLTRKIDKANTKVLNGVRVLGTNAGLRNEIIVAIKGFEKKLNDRIKSKPFAISIHKEALKRAEKSVGDLDLKLAEVIVNEGQFKSFVRGHISNMTAVTYNENRRVIEKVDANFTENASITLVKEQINKIKFNRNILNLSVVSHPRALYRNVIYRDAVQKGQNHFKAIVPTYKIKDLAVAGITAGVLYKIMTAQQWNKETDIKDNVNTVGGLGLHHGDFIYYYPADEENLDEEYEIAKLQRKKFIEKLDNKS